MTIRVVIADDQELVRAGFGMILDAQPDIEVVAEAGDGQQAIDAVRAHDPDVLLLDVRMPVMDGLEAARRVCAELPRCKVIMLTTFDVDDYVFDALYAGASGFLLKDVRRDDLAHAVRVVNSGEALLAPSVTRRVIGEVTARKAGGAPAVSRPLRRLLESLTARELETLRLVARGMSNAEIAGELVVSEHTVKTHVSNLLQKLGLRDRVHAVVFAYEAGTVTAGE
ncbi:response regulator [Kitasatospora sp. CB01950]|uniref:response regulator n=1 Tax=Kitasatospora sp. CB01950 TaxID=1703930 RepID=UPI0009401C4D|nr:response regulator transcription factor [Kitasatospora sp. CB01950]OKJ17156.1 LuxR family transcriptional regulator [Kitasatospora sp. CB01950]